MLTLATTYIVSVHRKSNHQNIASYLASFSMLMFFWLCSGFCRSAIWGESWDWQRCQWTFETKCYSWKFEMHECTISALEHLVIESNIPLHVFHKRISLTWNLRAKRQCYAFVSNDEGLFNVHQSVFLFCASICNFYCVCNVWLVQSTVFVFGGHTPLVKHFHYINFDPVVTVTLDDLLGSCCSTNTIHWLLKFSGQELVLTLEVWDLTSVLIDFEKVHVHNSQCRQ